MYPPPRRATERLRGICLLGNPWICREKGWLSFKAREGSRSVIKLFVSFLHVFEKHRIDLRCCLSSTEPPQVQKQGGRLGPGGPWRSLLLVLNSEFVLGSLHWGNFTLTPFRWEFFTSLCLLPLRAMFMCGVCCATSPTASCHPGWGVKVHRPSSELHWHIFYQITASTPWTKFKVSVQWSKSLCCCKSPSQHQKPRSNLSVLLLFKSPQSYILSSFYGLIKKTTNPKSLSRPCSQSGVCAKSARPTSSYYHQGVNDDCTLKASLKLNRFIVLFK